MFAAARVAGVPDGGIVLSTCSNVAQNHVAPVDGGTLVTSYYDWSAVDAERAAIFPIMSEGALRATLGILARTVTPGPIAPTS